MMPWTESWQRLAKLWVPAVVLVVANLGALVFYRLNYAGESAGLEKRLADKEHQLKLVEAERQKAEGLLEAAQVTRRQLDEVYRDRFATRRQRLTQVTEEVKSLAHRAGLDIESITYPEEQIENFDLVERSFVFRVAGTYQELRTLINFLELSPSFLTLEEATWRGGKAGTNEVSMDLTLATLFAKELATEPAAETPPASPTTAPPAPAASPAPASPGSTNAPNTNTGAAS